MIQSRPKLPASLPGPKPTWYAGSLGNLIEFGKDPIGAINRRLRRFGRLHCLVAGGNSPLNSPLPNSVGTVIAIGPEHNQRLLSDTHSYLQFVRTGLEDSPYRALAAGLLNMNGEKHKQQRRWMMPAFQKSRLDRYYAPMLNIIQSELAQWRPGQRRDLAADMRNLTLRVATKVFFGQDIDPREQSIGQIIDEWVKLNGTTAVLAFPWNLPFLPYRRLLRLSQRLTAKLQELIAAKRRHGGDTGDVMDVLVHQARDADGAAMSEDELIGQANLLFLAGHETTANTLTWTLFLLTQHPEIRSELTDELQGVLHGAPPSLDDLPRLPLLDRVIKESMRILPAVPLGMRTSATAQNYAGHDLPQYTEIVFSQYHTHHDPEIYPNPERFEPGRWEGRDPGPYEYIPFGGGARLCLGASFALMEIKAVLACLLPHWDFLLRPGTRIDRYVNLTMSPRQGLPIVLQQRADQPPEPVPVAGNIHEMVHLPGRYPGSSLHPESAVVKA